MLLFLHAMLLDSGESAGISPENDSFVLVSRALKQSPFALIAVTELNCFRRVRPSLRSVQNNGKRQAICDFEKTPIG